ncbi:lysozyme inhibitor LprI family protein [Methylomonas albis]|uniref:Uncharacterized protein n=1 Tax=Methylomonas albis TaxID=1854563 RepID=A0ABR9CVT8_9GAMM|nr:hypothetical protein [Methylomonas albis]MBD9354949.1 hypothetical protein [Methylomonas albis]
MAIPTKTTEGDIEIYDILERKLINICCRKIAIFISIISYFLTPYSTVRAASFDCQMAVSNIEKLICANQKLSNLDDQLHSAYKKP